MLVGFDIGGTNARALLVDTATWEIVDGSRGPSVDDGNALVLSISGMVSELEQVNSCRVEGIGIGIAGLAHHSGVVRYSPNLSGLVEFPLGEEVAAATGRPVNVGNDATSGTWAEAKLGAGRGVDDFIYVALGTGIGTGIVAGGQLITGSNGFAGEAGHMVVDLDGPVHHTGQRGPWEYFASGTSLGRLGREAASSGVFEAGRELAGEAAALTGHHVASALRAGSEEASAILLDFCREVARGIANLALILDPKLVILGGGLADIGDPLRDGVQRWLDRLLLGAQHRPSIGVVMAELGSESSALGAALLAADLIED